MAIGRKVCVVTLNSKSEPITFAIVVYATNFAMKEQVYIPNDSIGYLSGRVKREVTRLLARKLYEAGGEITAEQFRLLMMLWIEDGRNQQDLADEYGKDKTSIARMLQTMERQHLITRVPDDRDKRNNLIYITQRGQEVRAKYFPALQETLAESEAEIDLVQLQVCKDVLRTMISRISQINEDACKAGKVKGCIDEEENVNCDDH